MIIRWILALLAAYLIGSISPSIIYGKLSQNLDIRTKGSGNAGTTNMLRTLGKKAAVVTLLCDFLKACLAIWVANLIVPSEVVRGVAGLACIIGHCFPVYYSFKGGKGIACGAAVGLMLDWRTCLVLLGTFAIVLCLTRFVSAGSICATAIFPFSLWFFGEPIYYILSAAACAVVVLFMHRANMVRLVRGEERKLTFKK